MRRQFDAEQERPVPAAEGEGLPSPRRAKAAYKLMAKGRRAGRESEGSIVPLTLATNASRGPQETELTGHRA
jgi:hypothetical protein